MTRTVWWSLLAMAAIFCVQFCWMPSATASWLRITSPRVDDGAGIKLGAQSRLHPGVALGVGYDSNVFSTHPPLAVRDAAFLLPAAWIGVGNRPVRGGILDSPPEPTSRLVDYNISIVGGYRAYLARRDTVKSAGRLNIGGRLRVLVAPGRRFSLQINADLDRLGEPRNFEASREYHFDRIDSALGVHAILRPGAGRLSFRFGYVNYYLYFLAQDVTAGDRVVNGFEHETKWRVRDRSAFVVRYSWLWTYYMSCCAEPGTGRNEDSRAHRIMGGFVGQVGRRSELEALVGYGMAKYYYDVNGPNASKPLGRLGLSYYPTPRTRLHAAGELSFQDALFGNYHVLTGGEAFVSHSFRWNMAASLGASIYSRRTAGLPVPGREIDTVDRYDPASQAGFQRRDMLYAGTFKVEQPIGRYVVLGLQYTANVDDTDFAIYYTNGYFAPGAFARQQAMLITAVRY